MRRLTAALSALLVTLLAASALAADSFPRPPELEPAVRFWTRIYSEVSTRGGLLHDRENLAVIYETLQFGEDMSRPQRVEHVRERRRHYQRILGSLAEGKRDDLSAEEQRVLDLWPDNVDSARLRRAAGRIRFQLGQSDRFRRGLIRSGAWEPHIRRTLEEMGLPQEIAALPHVESSFNPNAYSRLGAAGIWQFTRATGRRFMRVDHVVDERMDPLASSTAAARLLQHNHSVTGDWALALTAYNHGLAGIRRAAKATGSDNIADIIREYDGRNWGFASRNFYPAFLAAVDVDFNADEYFGPLERNELLRSETVEMPFYASINDIMEAFGVDRAELRELNRGLRPPVWNGEKLVPTGYTLRVPESADRPSTEDVLARIGPDRRFHAQLPDRHHTVARGESLSTIAQRYDVSTRELISINNLQSADIIRVGQELRLPVSGATGTTPIDTDVYIVERGDNLSRIAQRAGMTVGALAEANNIDPGRPIQPGQELRVDGRPVEAVGEQVAAAGQAETDAAAEEGEGTTPGVAPAEETDATEAEPTTTADTGEEAAAPETGAPETTATAGDGAAPDAGADAGEPPVAMAEPGATEPGATGPADARRQALPERTRYDSHPSGMFSGDELDSGDSAQTDDEPAAPEDELTADPSDYSVAADDTIEIQAAETLGHYAEWLDLRASELRRLNNMRFGTPVVIGHRLALEFRRVDPDTFEQRRRQYHENLQARFFDQFRIVGSETQEIQRGDSLWTLARRHDNIPVWLLRQYNPDLDFDRLHPGMPVNLPTVERQPGPEEEEQLAADET